jgi:xanthine dehydrogenase iron-sulfur cluster and FAD-binding subunit A
MWERYFTPNSFNGALDLLAEHHDHARIVAGATDLILEIDRNQRPEVSVLIDVTRIPGLDQITLDEKGWIHLGPLVTHNHIVISNLISERAFALTHACWNVGAPQIRNRGTVAGNLITASPANDSIPPLIALGAQLTLRSKSGDRVVPLDEFYLGVRETVLRDDEILADIAFPIPSQATRSTFIKLGLRRAQAISVVNVAVVLEMHGSKVERAVIALGAVAPTIIRAQKAEEFLTGKDLTPQTILEAGDRAAAAARPIDDLRGSAKYRKEMIRVCTMRALRSLVAGSEREGFPQRPVMLWGSEEMRITSDLKESYIHGSDLPIKTRINGKQYEFESGHNKTLLRLLREDAGLKGTKEGCAEGECGACTVFLDGMAVMSCLIPAPRAHEAEIITVEGLAKNGHLHPVQQAFIEEGAVQCGYCTPGLLMSGAKLLEERPNPTHQDIVSSITGNLCRCTGYYKIISAIERAASMHQMLE